MWLDLEQRQHVVACWECALVARCQNEAQTQQVPSIAQVFREGAGAPRFGDFADTAIAKTWREGGALREQQLARVIAEVREDGEALSERLRGDMTQQMRGEIKRRLDDHLLRYLSECKTGAQRNQVRNVMAVMRKAVLAPEQKR